MIGIIAAMDIEVQAIADIATIERKEDVSGVEFQIGKIGNTPIVIGKSGVGKSTAAMTSTILCLKYAPDYIINVGTAGGLLEQQNVLDIVISDCVVQADFDTSPIDGPDGIGLVYNIDQKMKDLCVKASETCGISYHVGTISSQDIFMSKQEDFDKLMERFPASACSEMEAGAIAQVASQFNVPYVVVRCLSDVVVHNDNPMEFGEYASKASVQSAKLIQTLIESL